MNEHLDVLAAERGGWFTLTDALLAGYSESELRSRVRTGQWRRVCRDAYVEPAAWPADETPWERSERMHLLRARIVHHRLGGRAVLSHQSAALIYGLPSWGLDLQRVHLTRVAGRARSDRLMCCHRSPLVESDVTELGGLRLTVPARALVETANTSRLETAVACYDAGIRLGLVRPDELAEMAVRLKHWAGSPTARAAVDLADGRSESVGESRLRLLMTNQNLPAPDLQVELHDAEGQFVGRVDFLFWAYATVVEFDGELKYGDDGRTSLLAEKRREDRIRELGYRVVRVSWADLKHPAQTASRIRTAFQRTTAA